MDNVIPFERIANKTKKRKKAKIVLEKYDLDQWTSDKHNFKKLHYIIDDLRITAFAKGYNKAVEEYNLFYTD